MVLVTQASGARAAVQDDAAGRRDDVPRPTWPGIGDAVWRRVGRVLSLAATVLLIAVALAELDRLIASVPDADGRSHSLNLVLGPLGPFQHESWAAWAHMPWHADLGVWIALSAVLDLVMVAAYATLLRGLVRQAPRRAQTVPRIALIAIVGAEVLEDALQLVAGLTVANGLEAASGAVGGVLVWATVIKVLGFVVFGVAVLRITAYRSWLANRIARLGRAIWVHRLAALAIVVLLVLACIPAADLLDQLPDVQRQWADGPIGAVHGFAAIVAMLVTGALALALGRRRTRYMIETRVNGWVGRPTPRPFDAAFPWLIAPVAQIGLAIATVAIVGPVDPDGAFPVHLPTFLAVLVVELVIAGLAAIGARWVARHPEQPRPLSVERASDSWIVGDSLSAVVLVVGAVGVVRSFLVPLVLGGSATSVAGWLLVPVSAAVAVLAPMAVIGFADRTSWGGRLLRAGRLDPTDHRSAKDGNVSRAMLVEWIALGVGSVALVAAMLWPAQLGAALGAVAVVLLALGAWVAVLGSFTLILQARALIAPFRWLNMTASPVIALALVMPLAINVALSAVPWGLSDTALHRVHVSNEDSARNLVEPDALAQRLGDLRSESACTYEAEDGTRIRPVFLIASEGGGIRAAYWTASVLDALPGCAGKSGLVASGISGGSVGLALASSAGTNPQDADGSLVDSAARLSAPGAVSTAALALVVGDAVAGGWGVHMPSYLDSSETDDDGWRWRDRAALIESFWEQGTALGEPFTNDIDPLTGALLMNSADVVTKCRLLVQQAPVTAERAASDFAPVGGAIGPCDATGGLPSMLQFGELPGVDGAQDAADCLAGLDWSTAAMLSARFAVITPTGSMPGTGPCRDVGGRAGAQFVDGGYVEPTSLATIADIAPALMKVFAAVNDDPASDTKLVPVLLYLRNSQGYDLVTDVTRAEAEPLAPITGNAARVRLTAQDAWIQRIALTLPEACPEGDAACAAAVDTLIGDEGRIDGGVVVVAPASEPAVVPPLGWALSSASRDRFTEALSTAAHCGQDSFGELEAASSHYPGLDELPRLFERDGEVRALRDDMCDRIAAQRTSE